MTITLGYSLRHEPAPSVDLAGANEQTLHYDLFLGDIVFRVNEIDMSADWGWIPIIDFARCLYHIAKELESGCQDSFEFTESEHRIEFIPQHSDVEIRTTY